MKKSAFQDKEPNGNIEVCRKIIETAKDISKMGHGDIKFILKKKGEAKK